MKKSQPGFTFIEVVISLAIVGVISGLSISMLLQGTEIFVGAKDDSHLMNESRTAIWRISRDVHNLASNNLLELSNSNRIYIKDAKARQVDFVLNDKNININRNQQQNVLTGFLDNTLTNNFKYISSENTLINSSSGISGSDASTVNLLKLDLQFSKDSQKINLGTHVYPYGFKFGKKMSYHD